MARQFVDFKIVRFIEVLRSSVGGQLAGIISELVGEGGYPIECGEVFSQADCSWSLHSDGRMLALTTIRDVVTI